jgi:hypothetical protein
MRRINEELFDLAETYVSEFACIELYFPESFNSLVKLYVPAELYVLEVQAISTEPYGDFTTDSPGGRPCDEDGSPAHCIGDDPGA